jgi:hypothetical protein
LVLFSLDDNNINRTISYKKGRDALGKNIWSTKLKTKG